MHNRTIVAPLLFADRRNQSGRTILKQKKLPLCGKFKYKKPDNVPSTQVVYTFCRRVSAPHHLSRISSDPEYPLMSRRTLVTKRKVNFILPVSQLVLFYHYNLLIKKNKHFACTNILRLIYIPQNLTGTGPHFKAKRKMSPFFSQFRNQILETMSLEIQYLLE